MNLKKEALSKTRMSRYLLMVGEIFLRENIPSMFNYGHLYFYLVESIQPNHQDSDTEDIPTENAKYNFLFLARGCNCPSMNIASVVPQPGIKPNCMSSIEILSLMIFSITLSIPFMTCIKEFETSVVTSLHSITFPFVNVDDEAIFPIRWNDTISYHVIGKVSDQPCTSITRRLQHFRYYSRGPSSFASSSW